jgi:ubiquinone/menaquinone biosynthesis C-methylase UbiE
VLAEYIQKDIKPDARLLDLGAGYCFFINTIRAGKKHAVDQFDELKAYAAPDVQAHVGSCTDLHVFADDYFDVVFASNLFEHLSRPELEQTLAEIKRVLKVGGALIVLQPNFRYAYREYFDDYTHVAIFTEKSLADLLVVHDFKIKKNVARLVPFTADSPLPVIKALLRWYLRSPFRPLAKQMYIVAEHIRKGAGGVER